MNFSDIPSDGIDRPARLPFRIAIGLMTGALVERNVETPEQRMERLARQSCHTLDQAWAAEQKRARKAAKRLQEAQR
jgi:hypothetical protein